MDLNFNKLWRMKQNGVVTTKSKTSAKIPRSSNSGNFFRQSGYNKRLPRFKRVKTTMIGSGFHSKGNSFLSHQKDNNILGSCKSILNTDKSELYTSNYEICDPEFEHFNFKSRRRRGDDGEVKLKPSSHDYCFRLDDVFLFRLPRSRKERVEHNLYFDRLRASQKTYQKNGLIFKKGTDNASRGAKGGKGRKRKFDRVNPMKVQEIDRFKYRVMKVAKDPNYFEEAGRSKVKKSLQRQFFEIDLKSIEEIVKFQEVRQDWSNVMEDLQKGRRKVFLKQSIFRVSKNKPKSRYVAYCSKDEISTKDRNRIGNFKMKGSDKDKPKSSEANIFKKISLSDPVKKTDRNFVHGVRAAKIGVRIRRSRGKNKLLIPRESVMQISTLEGLYFFRERLNNYNSPAKDCLTRYSQSSRRSLSLDLDPFNSNIGSMRSINEEQRFFDIIREAEEETGNVETGEQGPKMMAKSMKDFRKKVEFDMRANLSSSNFGGLSINGAHIIVDEQDEEEQSEKQSIQQDQLRTQESPNWLGCLTTSTLKHDSKFKRREKATEIESPTIEEFSLPRMSHNPIGYDRDSIRAHLSRELKVKDVQEEGGNQNRREIEGKKKQITEQLLGIFDKCEQINKTNSQEKIQIDYNQFLVDSRVSDFNKALEEKNPGHNG